MIASFLSFLLSVGFAQGQYCPDSSNADGNFSTQQIRFKSGVCLVSLKNRDDALKKTYRSYSWNDNGMFMVFINIDNGSGRNSQTTGARVFYLLPADQPKLSGIAPKSLSYDIDIGNKIGFHFMKTDQDITSVSGCDTAIVPEVTWANKGGVDIKKCEGKILLDLGMRRGNTPELDRNRMAKVSDPEGNSCELKVSDIFEYPNRDEAVVKHKNQQQLASFLRSRSECKNLKLGFLGNSARNSSTPAVRGKGAN